MAVTYSKPSISGFNSNPPSDDGSQTAANEVVWATHVTKLGTPVKNLAESINDATETAFGNALNDAFTTRGDLLYEGASGEARLAVGSLRQALISDATDPTWDDLLTIDTVQATTSGASKSFTIPSWAKRITVNINAFSTNGTAVPVVQLGDSGGLETSAYAGSISLVSGSPASALLSSGFALANAWAATSTWHGRVMIELLDLSSNLWAATITGGYSDAAGSLVGAGTKGLSGTLTTVALVTSDTMDNGKVNVIYE